MASSVDYITVTGKNYASDLTNAPVGQKIVLFKDKVYHLLPLAAEEAKLPDIFSPKIKKESPKPKSKFWQFLKK